MRTYPFEMGYYELKHHVRVCITLFPTQRVNLVDMQEEKDSDIE